MKKLLPVLIVCLVLSGCKLSEITPEQIGAVTRSLESIGNAARPISEEEEYYVGRAVSARLLASYPLLRNQALTRYVNLVGQTVSLNSEKPVTHGGYHFAILDSPELNAFAAPGGTIFITRGMLNSLTNEDELAAVLAHEVGHVANRHGIAAIQSSRWTEALTIIGTEAAKTYGGSDLAKLTGIFEGSIDDVFKTLVVNGYGRSQEMEADSAALSILKAAGYDPNALAAYMERLIQAGKSSKGGIVSTHPDTEERLQEIKVKLPVSTLSSATFQSRTARFASIIR